MVGFRLLLLVFADRCGASLVLGSTCQQGCSCAEKNNGLRIVCTRLPVDIPNITTSFYYDNDQGDINGWTFISTAWSSVTQFSIVCRSLSIDSDTFAGLTNVTELSILSSLPIIGFSRDGFSNFKNLRCIDLSGNEWMTLNDVTPIISELNRISSQFMSLNASRTNNYNHPGTGVIVGQDLVSALSKLEVIDLSWAGVIIFYEKSVNNFKFESVQILNISYTTVIYAYSGLDEYLPNLRELQSAGMKISSSVIWKGVQTGYSTECTPNLVSADITRTDCKNSSLPLPVHLSKWNFDEISLLTPVCVEAVSPTGDVLCLKENNSLKYFSMRRSNLKGYNFIMYGANVMKLLDLRDNVIEYISNTSFRYLPSLEKLLLGHNRLFVCQHTMLPHLLAYNAELIDVDFSYNSLSYLSLNMFKHNRKIRVIDLSHNRLSTLSLDLRELPDITHIDLSYNNIVKISSHLFRQIPTPYITITENLKQCTCDSKETVRSMQRLAQAIVGFSEYQCILNDNSTTKLEKVSISDLESQCLWRILAIVIPVVSVVLLATCIGVLVYRHRAHIFKIYIRWRLSRYSRRKSGTEDRIFLVYCHQDKATVLRNIYPALNERLCQLLHTDKDVLYINDKDFRVPGEIDEEIVRAVNSTKATVVVVSKHYIQSTWSKMEVTYSWIRGKPLILLFLEKVPDRYLGPVLRYFYNKKVRLILPTDDRDVDVFWGNVATSLGKFLMDGNNKHQSGNNRALSERERDTSSIELAVDQHYVC